MGEVQRSRGWVERFERHLETLVAPTRSFPLERQAERIETVMRAFYAFVLLLAFPLSSAASKAWTSNAPAKARLHIEVASVIPVDLWNGARVVAWAFVVGGAIVLFVKPRIRRLRVLTAASLILATAISYDLKGKIEHGTHAAFWTAIGLCFLPDGKGDAGAKRRFVASFFGVQVLVMTLYTSAGICKLLGTFYDAPGGLTWFHPDALPTMIMGNWERSKSTLLGGFFVVHPVLACVSQCLAFVLEIGALPAVFSRHLQRPWALALIAMHVMILHSMMIHFHQTCFVLLVVLVASPFAPPFRETWQVLRRRPAQPFAKPLASATARGRRWTLLWGPFAAALYLVVAFSRFQPSTGAFRQELYPVSPMAMFFRLHPSPEGAARVAQLRERLERDGLFPERAHRPKGKAKRKRDRVK